MNAVRGDVADVALAGRLFAPHYAEPQTKGCIARAAVMRAVPSRDAVAVSQLLHGESFAVLDITGGWAWGYSRHDHYVGYVEDAALGPEITPTRIVSARVAPLFGLPDIKSPCLGTLPIGARVAGIVRDDGFVETAGGFIHARHLATPGDPADPMSVAELMIGTPYLWGGRGGDGIDCSGLVQLALGFAGLPAPRDSDQQRALLGQKIDPDGPFERGDILFFPGHVGLACGGGLLLHANAHWMSTVVEPLADVLARLGAAMPEAACRL